MKKLILSVLLIMGPVLIFGYLGKPVEMGIALFAGFTCAVIINLDKFSSFKAGEMEATIRHAEEVIGDANATIEQLKKATEPMMNYLLAHIAKGDTITGLNTSDKELLYLRLKENIEIFDLQNEYTSKLLEEVEDNIIRTSLLEVVMASEEVRELLGGVKPTRNLVFPDEPEEVNKVKVAVLRKYFNEYPSSYNEKVEKHLIEYQRVYDTYSKPEEI